MDVIKSIEHEQLKNKSHERNSSYFIISTIIDNIK